MAICKLCGMQVVVGEVYHADCAAAQIENIHECYKRLLDSAVEDIPHVGNYCAHLREDGKCDNSGEVCCKRVHTVCEDWKWRGMGE